MVHILGTEWSWFWVFAVVLSERKVAIIICSDMGKISQNDEDALIGKISLLLGDMGVVLWWKENKILPHQSQNPKPPRLPFIRSQSIPDYFWRPGYIVVRYHTKRKMLMDGPLQNTLRMTWWRNGNHQSTPICRSIRKITQITIALLWMTVKIPNQLIRLLTASKVLLTVLVNAIIHSLG